VGSFGGIIFRKFGAKTPGLHSNHGIQMGVEILVPPEDFCRNLIFLGGNAGVFCRVVGQIAQQLTERLRPVQGMTSQNSLDMTRIVGSVNHGHTGDRM